MRLPLARSLFVVLQLAFSSLVMTASAAELQVAAPHLVHDALGTTLMQLYGPSEVAPLPIVTRFHHETLVRHRVRWYDASDSEIGRICAVRNRSRAIDNFILIDTQGRELAGSRVELQVRIGGRVPIGVDISDAHGELILRIAATQKAQANKGLRHRLYAADAGFLGDVWVSQDGAHIEFFHPGSTSEPFATLHQAFSGSSTWRLSVAEPGIIDPLAWPLLVDFFLAESIRPPPESLLFVILDVLSHLSMH